MAHGVGGALAFDSVSTGSWDGGRQLVRELEHDVAGGRVGKSLVVKRQDETVFEVSGDSGVGYSPCMYSRTNCCKSPGGRSIEFMKTQVINELSQYCGGINPSPEDLMSWPISVA